MDAYVGCMYYYTNEFDLCRKEQQAFEKACPLEWLANGTSNQAHNNLGHKTFCDEQTFSVAWIFLLSFCELSPFLYALILLSNCFQKKVQCVSSSWACFLITIFAFEVIERFPFWFRRSAVYMKILVFDEHSFFKKWEVWRGTIMETPNVNGDRISQISPAAYCG
jgi:hypothetical protein